MRNNRDAEIERQIRLVGQNMRAARRRAGMSQTQLATVEGIDRAVISLAEKGIRSPDMRTLRRIAHSLGVPPAELLRGVGRARPAVAVRAGAPDGERFGERLRHARHAARLSQHALGHRARVDAAAISLYEIGQREPNLRTVLKLARTLGVRPADLLRGVA